MGRIFFFGLYNFFIITILSIDILYLFFLFNSFIISKTCLKNQKENYYDINYFLNIILFRGEKNKIQFKNMTVFSALFTPSSIFKSFWFFLLTKLFLSFGFLILEFNRCYYLENVLVKKLDYYFQSCNFNTLEKINPYLLIIFFSFNLILILLLLTILFVFQKKFNLKKKKR
jgi:hypothetical protein